MELFLYEKQDENFIDKAILLQMKEDITNFKKFYESNKNSKKALKGAVPIQEFFKDGKSIVRKN